MLMPGPNSASDRSKPADAYTSGVYRWWHLSSLPPELLEALDDGWIPRSGRVLDLGCGLGVEVGGLAERGFDAVGIDSSPDAIQRAASDHPNAEFLVGDVLDLPFPDQTYDVLLDRGCFHYVASSDRPRYEAEAWRVLRPGGRLLLRACLTSAGQRNDMPLDLVNRYFGRWLVAATAERGIASDRRLMRAVVARLEKPATEPTSGLTSP
jgi:SAM-dependent methyltransferase